MTGIADFFDPIGAFDLPPEEAIARFRAKGLRASFAWQDVSAEEHQAAFTIAKMMDVDLLGDVMSSLDAAMLDGVTFKQWSDDLIPTLQARGWWGRKAVIDPLTGKTVIAQLGSPWRLETIFRTNMQSAYAQGAWDQMEQVAEDFPFVLYDAVDDFRTREEHAAWDGKVVSITSKWLRTHTPPCGYNCRCGLIQLSADDVEQMGLKAEEPSTEFYSWENPRTGKIERVAHGVDPGFGKAADKRIDRLEKLLDEKIKALPAPAEKAAKRAPTQLFDDKAPAGEWHNASWLAAPEWMRPLIVREQSVGLARGAGGAWAKAGRVINMPPEYVATSPHFQDTWRHEFGHIIDVRLGSGVHSSSGQAFTDAMQADARALTKRLNIGIAQSTKQKRAEYLASYERAGDQLATLDRAERRAALEAMAKAAKVDLDELVETIKNNSAVNTDGIGFDVRLAKVLTAIRAGDPESFIKYAIGLDGSSYTVVDAGWMKGGFSSFSDLFGAATKNKVANIEDGYWGHSNSYYDQRKGSGQQTEAFANLTALAASPDRLMWDLVKRMAPKMAAEFERMIANG